MTEIERLKMREILLAVFTWAHLLSAVVWIGGIFFILFAALPAAKQTLYQPGKLMGAVSKRFAPIANISIFLIILSGIGIGVFSPYLSNLIKISSLLAQALFVKVLIALIMAGIHFYRGLILTPKITRLTAKGVHSEQVGKLQTMSLNLVKTNLVLGITVLLLTSILYAHRD